MTYAGVTSGCERNCQLDFEDLRFVDAYDGELLSAWNESTVNGDYCEVWLKLGSTLEVIMYYGNPDASPYWDIDAVFVDVIGGVVLALPMDEGSGSTVYDYSGNDNDGVFANNPEWVSEGVYFPTDADSVQVSHNAIYADMTEFSMYIKFTTHELVASNRYWLDKSRGLNKDFQIIWDWRKAVRFTVYTDAGTFSDYGSVFTEVDVPKDLVFVYNGSYGNIFMDGALDKAFVVTGTLLDGATSVGIGARGTNSDSGLNCTLSNFMWFTDVLSGSEIGNLNDFYGDSTILEGSVCCRVWVDVMPTATFGTEQGQISSDEVIGLIIVFFVIGISVSLALVIAYKKNS